MPGTVSLAAPHSQGSHLTSLRLVTEDLDYCGEVPLAITEEAAEVKYLSECKWGSYTSDESILFYGRDVDVTLTCWAQGETVLDNQ